MPELRVEVVYALADVQHVVSLRVQPATSAAQAVALSGLRPPGAGLLLGLFGRTIAPTHRLRDGDRVEILRPLAADPKEARRQRAKRRS
jgi:putative ubiquitin-RnfH superfamily antitoxin RatB of RatAB toxin-antitoxin module